MNNRWMLAGGAALFVALLVIGVLTLRCRALGQPDGRERQPQPESRVYRNASGEVVVRLDREEQQRIGLKVQMLTPAREHRDVIAYGMLEGDAGRSFTLRAPMSGILNAVTGRSWPGLGQRVADGEAVGVIVPRLTSTDRISLLERLSAARAELSSGKASVDAARAAFERAKVLNADEKNVSDRALQEAEARLRSEEARVRAAHETVQVLDSSLNAPAASAAAGTLPVERGGEVVDVTAQPGESIESGQPILRVARFDRLIARVIVPAGVAVSASVRTARIVVAGREARPVRGERIMLAPSTDPNLQGTAFLFRVPNPDGALRPGLSVTAHLDFPGEPRAGVIVPDRAIVRSGGGLWAYVQTAATEFTRRELSSEHPDEDGGWFTAAGFSPGEQVVLAGAQLLLSEESRSLIQVAQ